MFVFQIQIIKNSNVIVARFGMMHIVATNLCVWLNVIIQETKHEILNFQQYGGSEHDQQLLQEPGLGKEHVNILSGLETGGEGSSRNVTQMKKY